MTGLCGWFGGPGAAGTLDAMATVLNRFHPAPVQSAAAGFGAVAVVGAARECSVARHGDTLAAVYGHARFTDADLAQRAAERGLAQALAEAWPGKRSRVLSAVSGTFALAILDGASGEAALAVDRMSTRPLTYVTEAGRLAFASTLDALGAYPGLACEIDPQALYDYLHFHVIPAPRTVYKGRSRLLAGHCLLWRAGAAQAEPYWKMRFVEDRRQPFAEQKRRFLQVLRTSVRDAAAHGRVGAFLSGGTDSSTIAGLLGEATGKPARTYSIGFAAKGYDEMEYARIAARHFRTEHHEYYVTPEDVAAAVPAIAAVHDQPFGNSSAVPTYYCARLARDDGVDTLLGGDGGDELFGGNARYAHQHVLSLYSGLPAGVRSLLIEPITFALPPVGFIGKGQRYIRYASKPMPARYDDYNLLERLGPANVFSAEFLAHVDPGSPAREMARTYEQTAADTAAASLINRMLAFDFKYTLADNDLPKVARSCELAGVAVRFPFLDDAVVEFSGALPPRCKLNGTRLRYFFKQALHDFLPPAILAKTKHGFGLPFGRWLRAPGPLRELALDTLAALQKRRIMRAGFIDELASARLAEHAEYYGTMVWLALMLEQWCTEHRVSL